MSALRASIVLQKSKVASVQIFGETLKRAAIADSYNLSRATEVTYEFSVRHYQGLNSGHCCVTGFSQSFGEHDSARSAGSIPVKGIGLYS
jgi:hypothetical protein